MKHKNSSVFLYLRIALAGTLVLAAVALTVTATKVSLPVRQAEKRAYTPKKHNPDLFKPGVNAEATIGAEDMNPDSSAEMEAYLLRAYPDTEVNGDATLAAKAGWAALTTLTPSAGVWQLIGPSKATYPSVLTPFLFDGAQYVASGRVSAMAIGPKCTTQNCTLYVGAAGGGIWKTTKALAGSQNWQFISGSFGINAIGSILIDPTDSTGNTIYVGTGEPNASGDSEAGVGVYKSTDGGNTWALFPGTDIFFQRAIGQMALDNSGNLLVPIASGIRGASSVTSGASSSGATGHPLVPRGLYRCDGTSCTRIFTAPVPTRGSTTVRIDPTHAGVIYVNAFGGNFLGPGTFGGIWRSTNNGVTWSQIFAPTDSSLGTTVSALERDEFDVTTLPSGATRMYVGAGSYPPFSGLPSSFWRSDNVDTAATFTSMGGLLTSGYCSSQCWYDNSVYTPAGSPDVAYLGGSFDYPRVHFRDNGRAWLQTIDAGTNWSDLTQDGAPNHADAIHPDSHAIVTVPGKPLQFMTGGDGGVVGSDGLYANLSSQCDSRGLGSVSLALCKIFLSRVPNRLLNMNNGLSTLQFQSLSISAQNPLGLLQGGTQDNGTFQYNLTPTVWPQIIYGDGGQSGFKVTDDGLRFNTFTGQANDANFRKGDPTKWVIISAPIISSPEASYFYPPIIADPNAGAAATIFQGSFSVWRTQDWGGDRNTLEANCPEFTTSAAQPGCGDFVPLGCSGAACASGSGSDPGDLTGTFYGGDRTGGAVAWLQRAPQNTGTLWAATGAGRVFISDNADAAAASVMWTRLDAGASPPNRAISSIAVDPTNANHAWISYNGYNVTLGTTAPGHVFEAVRTGSTATFTDISYNLPDFPITALVRDDATGDLYAGSDFGVMKLPFGTTTWVVAGSGLPMVEVSGLSINSGARVLYAATHGRSAWQLNLP